MKSIIFTLAAGLAGLSAAAADFDSAKSYSIRNVQAGTYLSLQTSYVETVAVNAAPLVADPVGFTITPSADGKTYAIGNADGIYLTLSTSLQNFSGWNTGYTTKPAYDWTISPVEKTAGQYTITSSRGFLKYDGKNDYAYTDGKAGNEGNYWLIEEMTSPVEPDPGVPGIDFPVANLRGDMNGDGLLTMADVTAIIDVILGRKDPTFGTPDIDNPGTDDGSTADFPKPDGSPEWYLTDKPKNLASLLLKIDDPNVALSRSMFASLTDAQYAEIGAQASTVCKDCKSQADKIAALSEWVSTHVIYGQADNSPYTVFKSGVGICQGYSNLLKVMLISQGIPAIGVNGWYGQNNAHAWTYAYDGKEWYVCDATNTTKVYPMSSYADYSRLNPDMADITLFEDDECVYNYYEGYLNVCRVKRSATSSFVVPYGARGLRVGSFNPTEALPANVRRIYIGSNIRTFGQSIVGLRTYRGHDEQCFVDPYNKQFGSYEGVVYTRDDYTGQLKDIFYIPSSMTTLRLQPIETVGKNAIIDLENIEVIVFPEGTKTLEPWAIESCPKLRKVYVPKGCTVMENAIYRCPADVEVIYGQPAE